MAASLHLTPDRRIAGVLIPIFALRSEDDAGIGDTGLLRRFVDWAADAGFALVQLLPINETGGDNSPYNAISSMALDPTTLELTPAALPDLLDEDVRAAEAAHGGRPTGDGPVRYSQVKPLKLALLRRAFERFGRELGGSAGRVQSWLDFRRKNAAWLEGYTLFRALMDREGGTECWDRWPEDRQTFAKASVWEGSLPKAEQEAFAKTKAFFAYVQWIAYGQWKALKEHAAARGVALMGDIPLGVSYYSADFFTEPALFEQGWSGGAPPEPYFKDDPFTQKWGQNWGIPVYDWAAMRRDGFRWWRQRIGGVRDLFHVFRIDHILGFYRIYSFPWRPERNAEFLPLDADEARERCGGKVPGFKARGDDTWEDRQANCALGEELLRVMLEAAGDTRLIGEDLGTVPDYVRPNLARLGIAGFKIPIWESDPRTGGVLPGGDYERLSLATYGTHDHEPLLAFWNRSNRLTPEERQELYKLAGFAGLSYEEVSGNLGEGVHDKLMEALFRSNSWIAVCMITDLLSREERFNVPGTAADSNWSQRMHVTLETLCGDPAQEARDERFRAMLARSGRILPG